MLLANYMKAERKVYCDRRNYKQLLAIPLDTDKMKRRLENLFHVGRIFDYVVHPSRDTVLLLEKYGVRQEDGKRVAEKLFFDSGDKDIRMEKTALFEGNEYRVQDFQLSEDGQAKALMIRGFDQPGPNYVVNVPICSIREITEIVERFAQIKREKHGVRFHIFDLYEQWGKHEKLTLQNGGVGDCTIVYSGADGYGMEDIADGVVDLEMSERDT
jgi:hypothetical protein